MARLRLRLSHAALATSSAEQIILSGQRGILASRSVINTTGLLASNRAQDLESVSEIDPLACVDLVVPVHQRRGPDQDNGTPVCRASTGLQVISDSMLMLADSDAPQQFDLAECVARPRFTLDRPARKDKLKHSSEWLRA